MRLQIMLGADMYYTVYNKGMYMYAVHGCSTVRINIYPGADVETVQGKTRVSYIDDWRPVIS